MSSSPRRAVRAGLGDAPGQTGGACVWTCCGQGRVGGSAKGDRASLCGGMGRSGEGRGKCQGRQGERVYGHVVGRAEQGRGKCQGRHGERVYGHVVVRARGSARGDWRSVCMDMLWSGEGRGKCQGRHRCVRGRGVVMRGQGECQGVQGNVSVDVGQLGGWRKYQRR